MRGGGRTMERHTYTNLNIGDSTHLTYIYSNYLGTLGSCSNLSCGYDSLSIGNNDADCFSSLDLIQLFAELCGLLHKVLVPSKYLSRVLSVESDISILLTTSTMGCIHNTMKNFCRLYFQERDRDVIFRGLLKHEISIFCQNFRSV